MASAGSADNVVQPETDFAEFYRGVISKLNDLKCLKIFNDVKSALIDMKKVVFQRDKAKQTVISYKTTAVRSAYMYANSTLDSVMLYSEFSRYLELNKKIMMPTLLSESLNLCCIGGGPGTEAIAVCKSINDFLCKSSEDRADRLLEIKVTVVDKIPHWKREEIAVINAVNDETNVLHSKGITLQHDFLRADILKPFEKDLKEKIKEANFVTVIKIGSYVNEKNPGDCTQDLQNMLRNVINNMNDNSCLFMLDISFGKVFYNMRKVLREEIGTSLLKTSENKEYCLVQKTVDKLSSLMNYNNNPKYHPMPPTEKDSVSSCLWIKNALPTNESKKSSNKEVSVKTSSENSCSSDMHYKGDRTLGESSSYSKTQSCTKKKKSCIGKQTGRCKK